MPSKAKTPCKVKSCANLVEAGKSYCENHESKRHKQYDRDRKPAHKRGYDYRWQKYRKQFLIDNPLCVKCLEEGKSVPATNVDHIEPVSGPDDPLFWDEDNHQALCHSCHSRKTAREDGGYGNKKKNENKTYTY